MRKAIVILTGVSLAVALLLCAPVQAGKYSTKPGVVEKCSGFLKRSWRNIKSKIKKLRAKKSKSYPNIAIVQDNGDLLEKKDINLKGVAQIYYQTYRDDRHFLFIFAQGGKNYASGYNAYYHSVRNSVKGIGRKLVDYSKSYGSNSKLLGLANMNGTDKWKAYIYPLLELWPLGVIIHELGHQWVAYVDNKIKGIQITTDPNSGLRSHWQPLVHTDASIMYGNKWRRLTKARKIFGKKIAATFGSTSLPKGFSKLDKYLMGILPASKVSSFFAIKPKKKKIWNHFAMPGNWASGDQVQISIKEVQQALGGPRVPDYSKSLKRFKAAFILVVPKGKSASAKALKVVEYFRKRIPERLRKLTDKKFYIDSKL